MKERELVAQASEVLMAEQRSREMIEANATAWRTTVTALRARGRPPLPGRPGGLQPGRSVGRR